MIRTFEIFTEKYSKIAQAETPAGAEKAFWRNVPLDEDPTIIAIIDIDLGKEFINGKEETK